jgi:hypothetical protein
MMTHAAMQGTRVPAVGVPGTLGLQPGAPVPTHSPLAATTPTQKPHKKHESHWLNNAGYALYAGVGAIKQVGVLQKAVANDNPTLVMGMVALLGSYPPVFFSHDLYAKMLMLVAFHLSEMAESAGDYNTFVGNKAAEAKALGIHVEPYTTGLPGMKDWMNAAFFKRLLSGKATQADLNHRNAFADTLKRSMARAWGSKPGASGQALAHATDPFKVRKSLHLGIRTKALTEQEIKALPKHKQVQYYETHFRNRKNIYHMENAGAFGGLLGVLGETAAETVGLRGVARFVTQPWLMGSNLLQTIGFTATTKNIWTMHKTKEHPAWAHPKAMAVSEGAGTLLCAIGAASWSNDWLLGLYRLGSVLKTPFRMFQRGYKREGFEMKTIPLNDPNLKTALRSDKLSFVVDGLSALAILGSPLVAAYELKHHTSLNPLEWGRDRWQAYQGRHQKQSAALQPESERREAEENEGPKSLVQLTQPETAMPIVPLRHRNTGAVPLPSARAVPLQNVAGQTE